jgi:hypothetical protein
MSKFDTKEDLIITLQMLFENLNQGSINEEELETMVSTARELYERTLILRYKAYERKVFGEQEDKVSEENQELIIEETPLPEKEVLVEEDKPTFDMAFSLFDELESTNDADIEEEVKEEEDFSDAFFQESIKEVSDEVEFSSPLKNEASEIIEVSETIETPEETKSFHSYEEKPVASTSTAKDVFDKMLEKDDSLGAKLMGLRIDSLNGVFGLNEKLQLINDLFDGSSESFYQAIKIFDNASDFEQAKLILSNYANEFSWELDNELVIEFVQKVARRYA